MRSTPSSWSTFWTSLGFIRNRRKQRRKPHRTRRSRFECLEDRRMLAVDTFIVDTVMDVVDANDGVLSFREALIAANDGEADRDTITFAPSLYSPEEPVYATSPVTLLLGDTDGNGDINGAETPTQLVIDSDVTIMGPGADQLSISADYQSRLRWS